MRLGIVAEGKAMEKVKDVMRFYPEYEMKCFLYTENGGVSLCMKPNEHELDAWVIIGQFLFGEYKRWNGARLPVYYVPYRSASVYKTLCEVFYKQRAEVDKISFDMIDTADLEHGLAEMEIPYHKIWLHCSALPEFEEIVAHHLVLWQAGKILCVATGVEKVGDALRRQNVPVFDILPVRAAIKRVLNKVTVDNELMLLKNAQIAVQIIRFELKLNTEKFYSPDEIYQKELRITEILLRYAGRVKGSLKKINTGKFYIFTTRGMIAEQTRQFCEIPEFPGFFSADEGLHICGTGIGNSVYEAEFHAEIAFQHALKCEGKAWFVVLDNKEVVGPLGEPENLSFPYFLTEISKLASESSISAVTLEKVFRVIAAKNCPEISAQELSKCLNILPRSARKIITDLKRSGIAVPIGEEKTGFRGRPGTVYRILFDRK